MRTRDWVLLSILSLVAIICIRLGIWQLDRRQERLSLNEWTVSQLSQEPTTLGSEIYSLAEPEYRKIEISGNYQNEHTVVLRNRSYSDQPGVHLVTPLSIENGNGAILVDRGWISNEAYIASGIQPFREDKFVKLVGIIRLSQPEPSISFLADPTREPGSPSRIEWRVLNVERIQEQIPFELHPFFLELVEPLNDTEVMPIPNPEIDLSQGPHLSYAIQWFGFAGVALGGGFAWWRRRQPRKDEIVDDSLDL
jgi:surfeit locus 1 family protein